MNKNTEKKILEELKKRVLERDKELRSHKDDENIKEATKEALTEMTILSRKEVDEIERKINAEIKAENKRKQKIRQKIIGVVAVVLLIIANVFFNKEEKMKIVETFDTREGGWDEYEKFEYKREMKDGKYFIENDKDGMCAWDYIDIDFPQEYCLELHSKWEDGNYDAYGMVLLESVENYFYFEVRGDGSALVNYKSNGKWTNQYAWESNVFESGKKDITQKLEVKGNFYRYYVNGKLFQEGNLRNYRMKQVGMMVCGKQKIGFESLVLTRMQRGKMQEEILNESFANTEAGWTFDEKLVKRCYYKDKMYFLQNNTKDLCFWSCRPFELPQNYRVSVQTKWVAGEHAGFEIVLHQDDNNFIGLEAQANGKARFVTYLEGEYDKIQNYKQTSAKHEDEKFHELAVEVRGEKFRFYVDNEFVDSWNLCGLTITEVGVRVCGRQTVAFDNLIIEEL
ncbi:MAG: hypothetical protein CSB01_01720 [Bacteroidia bacterium]|nr:MAG: hypothetical protein CSB01_01720 [Bacteroidia bacterium]